MVRGGAREAAASGGEAPGEDAEEHAQRVRRPVHADAREEAAAASAQLAGEDATERGEEHGAADDGGLGEGAQPGDGGADRLVAGGRAHGGEDVPEAEEQGGPREDLPHPGVPGEEAPEHGAEGDL